MIRSGEIRERKKAIVGNLASKENPTPSGSADLGTKRPDLAPQNDERKEENDPASSSANDGTKVPDLTPNNDKKNEGADEKHARFLALYKAATSGDWTTAKRIFGEYTDALTATLYGGGVTVLHVAVVSAHGDMSFLRNLVDLMVRKGISLGSGDHSTDGTPLHFAAEAGNTKVVSFLVEKDPTMTRILDRSKNTPLNAAAFSGHEETIRYLLPISLRVQPSCLAGCSGAEFLCALIMDGFYDIALQILEEIPRLSVQRTTNGATALFLLAQKPLSVSKWDAAQILATFTISWLCCVVWVRMFANRSNSSERKDVENPTTDALESNWKILPQFQIFNGFHMEQLRQKEVMKLLKSLVDKASKLKQATDVLRPASRMAVKNGIHEFVAEVIKGYPQIVNIKDRDGRGIFNLAVRYRQEKVFNLIFQLASWKHSAMAVDRYDCTMLHHAAKLDSYADIGKIPGAALQMQRELQWYKEVEKIVQPSFKVLLNNEYKTPDMVFTESHKKLVNEGERWMKDTSNSYTIVAALIVTITFAAAYTVPGGNNGDTGLPIFLNDLSFMVFATSNALALFSSTTSLLMFLGILTSRYSQEDFLKALPMRLAIGLITLFFSIASMLVAFSVSLHLMLSHRVTWIAIPIGLLACLPLVSFAFLQFPLLVEAVCSTFGPSIFRKQCDDILI